MIAAADRETGGERCRVRCRETPLNFIRVCDLIFRLREWDGCLWIRPSDSRVANHLDVYRSLKRSAVGSSWLWLASRGSSFCERRSVDCHVIVVLSRG